MFYATQARENRPYYYHEHIGYNYRLSNICAGIGRGQMLVLKDHIARRREIHHLYTSLLKYVPGIEIKQNSSLYSDSNFWLTCILVDPDVCKVTCDDIRIFLAKENIESRLLWRPMHMQPVYKNNPFYGTNIAENIFDKGLCLPSGSSLTDRQILFVAERIKNFIIKKNN